MRHVQLTIIQSRCRAGLHRAGETHRVGDVCPPICHELWQCIYPMVYALLNGADLDYGDQRRKAFEFRCPDEGRVLIRGEAMEQEMG